MAKLMTRTRDGDIPPGNTNHLPLSNILNLIHTLRESGDALYEHEQLHRALISIEWQEEKKRISQLFILYLIGLAFFICLLIFSGATVMILSWNTEYRLVSALTLCAVYAIASYFAWRRFLILASRPDAFFASTRQELMGDIAMIKRYST